MKRIFLCFAVVSLLLLLAACSAVTARTDTQTAPETTSAAAVQTEPETAPETVPATAPETVPETAPAVSALQFSSVDIHGDSVDESLFAGHKLIMLNFWEPWCGPCVAEMPDLQKLSEAYAEKGLLIIGIHYEKEGVSQVLESTGVQYPIVEYREEFYRFTTPYVPTTVFLNENGELLQGPEIGSRGFEDWAQIVEGLL